jgi:hypothetical protein
MAALTAKTKREADVQKLANVTLRPSANAAAIVSEYGKAFGEQDVPALMTELSASMESLKTNDLSRCENMLLGQAHALQTMFMNLSLRAAKQEHMKNIEAFMRMALKAQNQCRMTLETLATIKNPPIVYAKQANINHGNQQVNNGIASPSHTGENKIPPNELLESKTHEPERLDTSAPRTTSRTHKAMAAVGKVHGRKN